MSRRTGPWGTAPNRTYRTDGDPTKRRYESDERENWRRARYAAAEVRADGEHYNWPVGNVKEVTLSLEGGERQHDEMMGGHRPGGFKALLSLTAQTVWHMGMYSDDPALARMAIVHTAREQIGVQRQLSAQQQQQVAVQHAQERAQDKADRAEEMEVLARAMAKAMFDEADARRAS